MVLYDNKKELAEAAVKKAISEAPIIDAFIKDIMENKEEWVTKCQGYYDSRSRRVTIERDSLRIDWIRRGDELMKASDSFDSLKYRFTDCGYLPLHHHQNADKREDVSGKKVITIFAAVFRERLQAVIPDAAFSEISETDDTSYFHYRVPPLEFKDWF